MKCDECLTETAGGLDREWMVGNLASQRINDHGAGPGAGGWGRERSYTVHNRFRDIEPMQVFVCTKCRTVIHTGLVRDERRNLLLITCASLGLGGIFVLFRGPDVGKTLSAVATVSAILGIICAIAALAKLAKLWRFSFRADHPEVLEDILWTAANRKRGKLKRQFMWTPAEFEREFNPKGR